MPTDLDLTTYTSTFQDDVETLLRVAYGEAHWEMIKDKLALPPSNTCLRVNTLKSTVESAIIQLKEHLDIFNAALEKRGRRPVEIHRDDALSDVFYLSSCPPLLNMHPQTTEKHIVVDRLCGEAVIKGSDIFARGIMAASEGINESDEVNVWVDLDHLTCRGTLYNAYKGRKIFLGKGRMCMSRSQCFRVQKGLATVMIGRVCRDNVPLNGILPDVIYAQNLPSAVIAHVLHPQPNETILDMCAAPGGKTSHLAALMNNQGLIIACDRGKKKTNAMADAFSFMGITCIKPLKADSTQLLLPKEVHELGTLSPQQVIEQYEKEKQEAQEEEQNPGQKKKKSPLFPGFYAETFDRILLDPPCSALGLRPRLTHETSLDELRQYTKVQRNLAWVAAYLLKVGGVLVYSTCTLNPQENEQMVKHMLDRYPFLELVTASPLLGQPGLSNEGLSLEEGRKVQRFDPTASLDTMGFFGAKFIKTESVRNMKIVDTDTSL